jgi:steroid delta-isomerase-like uncharacterized protein
MNAEGNFPSQPYREPVRRVIEELFNAGQLAVVSELYAAEYIRHDPATPDLTGGLDGIKEVITRYRTAFPDLQLTQEDLVAEGDKAVVRWSAHGTQHGELPGIAPTGRAFTITGLSMYRFVDGQIVEEWTNWDTLGMLQQLGMIPG